MAYSIIIRSGTICVDKNSIKIPAFRSHVPTPGVSIPAIDPPDLTNEKNLVVLGIGDEILPSYVGVLS